MMTTKISDAKEMGIEMVKKQWLSLTVSKKAPKETKKAYIEKKKAQHICSKATPMNPNKQKTRFIERKTIQVFLMHST